ncbi:unnamed protein product [Gulo gulo]|uniref:Uncharacterized protein n=1 Tax=Gulo gulo TaxID=48420 RepID=A0A9X9M5D4_GULGU|nr:unnamed protein product [Gulo gulo]
MSPRLVPCSRSLGNTSDYSEVGKVSYCASFLEVAIGIRLLIPII